MVSRSSLIRFPLRAVSSTPDSLPRSSAIASDRGAKSRAYSQPRGQQQSGAGRAVGPISGKCPALAELREKLGALELPSAR
jgi:hypothetical protein